MRSDFSLNNEVATGMIWYVVARTRTEKLQFPLAIGGQSAEST